ncbi:MAG: hypothetical protein AB1651_18980 [Pseudomonadota bacterium]
MRSFAALRAPLLLALFACSAASVSPQAGVDEWRIDSAQIDESSGLARSRRSADLLWTHNDSGGAAEAYAVDREGRFLGTLRLAAARNVDWEDIAAFVEDGRPRLLIADTGDNNARRPFVMLYVVDEPDVSSAARPFAVDAVAQRAIRVTYPDGARDVEGVAVDARAGHIYLLSKRDAVPRLYRVPLAPDADAVVAEALGEIAIPRAMTIGPWGRSFNYTTAMDIDDAGSTLVVTTYTHAYLYRRAADESWPAALRRAPQGIALPDYAQIEACALDGAALWLTSEGVPAPLARVEHGS